MCVTVSHGVERYSRGLWNELVKSQEVFFIKFMKEGRLNHKKDCAHMSNKHADWIIRKPIFEAKTFAFLERFRYIGCLFLSQIITVYHAVACSVFLCSSLTRQKIQPFFQCLKQSQWIAPNSKSAGL